MARWGAKFEGEGRGGGFPRRSVGRIFRDFVLLPLNKTINDAARSSTLGTRSSVAIAPTHTWTVKRPCVTRARAHARARALTAITESIKAPPQEPPPAFCSPPGIFWIIYRRRPGDYFCSRCCTLTAFASRSVTRVAGRIVRLGRILLLRKIRNDRGFVVACSLCVCMVFRGRKFSFADADLLKCQPSWSFYFVLTWRYPFWRKKDRKEFYHPWIKAARFFAPANHAHSTPYKGVINVQNLIHTYISRNMRSYGIWMCCG